MTNMYGRQTIVPLTNKSGGGVVAGDVVIIDTANDTAFTTTTTGQAEVTVGIAQETIASNAIGRVLTHGYAALVNVPSSMTRGRYLETHTVAKQATGSATRRAGSFGQFLISGTTPSAILWGQTDQTASGGGAGIAVTGCKAYHSTTQSITGGTTATLSFDSEEFDGASYHDTVTNNSRLTVPATGLYAVGCSAYSILSTTQEIELWLRKNGTTDQRGGVLAAGLASSSDGVQAHYSTVLSLTAADYLEVRCFLKNTSTVGSASATLASEFWIYRLT